MKKNVAHTLTAQIRGVNVPSATEVALRLKAHTKFSTFVSEGHGACLITGDTIFGYIATENGDVATVVKTGHSDLLVNDFVYLREVSYHASHGEGYFPSTERTPHIENKRVAMFEMLLALITAEGGHEAVLEAIQARRATRDEVMRIVKDMRSGVLPTNLIEMFRDIKKAKALGIIVNNSPLVFYKAYQKMPVKNVIKPVLAIRLGAAPHGVEGFDIGTFVPLANLFIEHSNKHVAAMVKVLVDGIHPEDLDEVKRLTHELARTEGRILEQTDVPVPVPLEINFQKNGTGESVIQLLH